MPLQRWRPPIRVPNILLVLLYLPLHTYAYYSRYSVYDPPPSLSLSVCQDSVVTVEYIGVLCDSPYTFYYGNGANRNSILCDYGDKATLMVTFSLQEPLQEKDKEIYVTMAAYDDEGGFMVGTYPERLCQEYVGDDCTQAGVYTFSRKLKFGYPPASNATKFNPTVQMAFSTASDAGSNLGAVNTVCQQQETVSWSQENIRSPVSEWVLDNGILIATSVALVGMGVFVWKNAKDSPGFEHLPPYLKGSSVAEEISFMEL